MVDADDDDNDEDEEEEEDEEKEEDDEEEEEDTALRLLFPPTPIPLILPPLALFPYACDASVAFRNSAAVKSHMRRSNEASVEKEGSSTLSSRHRSSSNLASV
jgi:hypothetical protein